MFVHEVNMFMFMFNVLACSKEIVLVVLQIPSSMSW